MGLESSSQSLQAQQSANPVSGSTLCLRGHRSNHRPGQEQRHPTTCVRALHHQQGWGGWVHAHAPKTATDATYQRPEPGHAPNHPSCHLTFTDAARPAVARQASTVKACEGCWPVKAGAIGVGNGSSNSTGVWSTLIQICRQSNIHSTGQVSLAKHCMLTHEHHNLTGSLSAIPKQRSHEWCEHAHSKAAQSNAASMGAQAHTPMQPLASV